MRLRLLLLPVLFIAFTVFTLQAQTSTFNWIKKNGPSGGEITDIEVDPASGKVFLLDSDSRPYVSTDNGNTWQALTFTGSDEYFTDIEITNGTIFLVGAYELFASTDGGATFVKRMGASSPYNDVRVLKRAPVSGNLVALSYSGLYVSTDNGVNWTLKNNSLGDIFPSYLAINSVDQIFILARNESTFYFRPHRSVNGGSSFTETSTNIPSTEDTHGLFADNTGSNIYCVTTNNVYSSTDGTNWVSIKTGSITGTYLSDYGYLQKGKIEFSADGLGMYFIDNYNQQLHSKGTSETNWQLRASDFPGPGLGATCASALNYADPTTSTVYFGTPAGVFKTTTGGASISESNTGIVGLDINNIFADYDANLYMDAGALGWMKSTNEGDTWNRITNVNRQIYYFFNTPHGNTSSMVYSDALFVLTDEYKLLRSYDEAVNWYEVSPLGGFVWAGSIGASKIFGLPGNYSPITLHYSKDNGSNWTASPISVTGLPAGVYINARDIVIASENWMFISVDDNTTISYYRVDLAYDADENLTSAAAIQIATPIPYDNLYQVEAANGRIFLYNRFDTGDAFAVSADGGVTWSTPVLPFLASNTRFFAAPNGYLFFADGSSDKLFLSRDDGETFVELPLPASVDGYQVSGVALDRDGIASLAVDDDYLYRGSHTLVLPPSVTDLQEVGFSHGSVALRWIDTNESEHTVAIERSTNGVDFVEVGQRDEWERCYNGGNYGFFVDTQVQPSITYTYRVKARNAAGDSEPTATVMVTTGAECAPTIPDNRSWSATNLPGGGHTPLAAPVTVGIKHLGEGKYIISDVTLGLTSEPEEGIFYESCEITALGSEGDEVKPNGNGSWVGGTLTLKWRECNEDKTETISLTLNADDPAPSTPAKPFAHVLSNTSIEVSWKQGYYESSYVIERSSTGAIGSFTEIATVNYPQVSFVDADVSLTWGTTYYYRIKAVNGNTVPLESAFSEAAIVLFQKPNFVVADNPITDYYGATLGSIWADFDNDGLDDYMTMNFHAGNESASPVFFRNLGSGSFAQVTPDFGTGKYLFPAVADFDNDGYADILLSGDESLVLDLFKGNGDLTFSKIAPAQLGAPAFPTKKITATSWGNVNNDARPDLLVMHDDDASFTIYTQNADHSFTKAFDGPPSGDASIMAIWADYDNDGHQDFLKTSFEGGIGLYRNNGNNTFSQVTDVVFATEGFIGAAWGDYDNDGDMDLFGGMVTENALYRNNGDGTFTKDVSTSISEQNFCLSASWGDYNNDGYLDLITGSIPLPEGSGLGDSPTRLFLRDPSVTTSVAFKRVDNEKLNDRSVGHYSLSNADADQNGLLDVAMAALAQDDNSDDLLPAKNTAFLNNSSVQNWSQVRLAPTAGGTEAIGARVTLTAAGQTQMRHIAAATSLVSRNSTTAHFGLGSATTITNIQVKWPNGSIQNYPSPPINQILVIDEDVAGPAITSQMPANNAAAVSPNTPITLVFNEPPTAISAKNIHITKTGETVPVMSIDVSSGTITGNQLVYTLAAPLEPLVEYNVTIDAGAFQDRYTNASAEIATGTWKFVTTDAPAIITLAPAHNATNVSAPTSLSVTFDKPVTAVSGKLVNVYEATDLTTPLQSIDATTGVKTGNTIVFTMSSKLQRSITYQVSIDAGAFVDAEAIGFQGLASSDWVFTTDPGPSYTVSPVHNAVDVAADASLQITFDETVTTTAGKKIKVMDGATVVSEGDVSAVGTLAANVYTYPAPGSGWPYSKVLKITLDEGAFVDAQGNDAAPVVAESWNFTTVEAPDVTAPVISFTVPASPPKGFESVSPSITVSDNKTVSSVVVSIRKLSESAYTDVTATAGATADTYTVTLLEATHFDAIGAEFYITATDLAGNTIRDPAEPGTHKVYLTYNETQSAIPTSSLGVGGRQQDWKVFAIPFELPAPKNEVTELFDEFEGLTNKVDYRLVTLGGDQLWFEYSTDFTTLNRGVGYFINFKINPGIIKLFNDLQAPANSRSNLYPMNLKAGWNMIGNPYLTPISWDDVVELNGLSGTAAQLKTFSGGTYSNDQILAPYQGGFVLMDAAKTISIPFEGQIASGGRRGVVTLGEDISAPSWALPIIIRQEGLTYTLGGVGMAPEASPGIDNYDDVTPPRFFDYLEMNFSHPEHIAKRFTREIVPTQENYTWDFTVDSNLEGMASLAWNNAALMASGKDVFLLDVTAQTLVDMKVTGTHRFDPKESSKFRIYYGDNLNITPETVRLGKAYPNPANGVTTIAFSLPETGGLDQSVTLDIVDALGRTVGTIEQGRFNPGYHEAAFDASDMMKGFYTYRLTVKNRLGQKTQANKLIIK